MSNYCYYIDEDQSLAELSNTKITRICNCSETIWEIKQEEFLRAWVPHITMIEKSV